MTAKEFVLRIYPDAKARNDSNHNNWGVWDYDNILLSKYAVEVTEEIAWQHVVDNINNKIMRKLES
jgi:hypothetical protein